MADEGEGLLGCIFISIVLAIMLVIGLVKIPGCYQGYSDGTRAGVVLKFSNKGLMFKSYEGELKMVTNGTAGQMMNAGTFKFSCRKPDVALKIQAAIDSGRPVTLKYTEWLMHPWTISTGYEVLDVQDIQDKTQ